MTAATLRATLADGAEALAAAGMEDPRSEARLLLGAALGVGTEVLLGAPERLMEDGQRRLFDALVGRRAAREHYPILVGGERVGEITSGSFSPTLQRPIAMGYVPPEFAEVGTALQVDLRGRPEEATVVALPFYKRSS